MRKILAAVLTVLMMALVTGCTSKQSASSTPGQPAATNQSSAEPGGGNGAPDKTHLAKTKFALHAGLAFGAFHRYIYKPYKAGKFSGGILHHKAATLKAAVAAAFAYHEVKLALVDARSSKVLSRLLSPLLALQTKLSGLQSGLRHGTADPAAIQSANSDTGLISSQSAKSGQPIQDQPTPQLGG